MILNIAALYNLYHATLDIDYLRMSRLYIGLMAGRLLDSQLTNAQPVHCKQVAGLLHAQANSTYYPQWDVK